MYSANARTSTHARSYVLAMTHICAVPMTMDVYVLHATTSSMLSTWRRTSCNHHGIFLQTRASLYIARMWYLQYVGNLRAFFPIYICTIAACSNGANKIRLYMLDSKNSRKNFSFCRLIFCPSKTRHLRLLSLTQLLSGLSGLVNITSRKKQDSYVHRGHEFELCSSHWSTHDAWKTCLHERIRHSSSSCQSSKHTRHLSDVFSVMRPAPRR